MRAAKIQASLRIRAVSPEPSLLAHTSSESRGTFRQKARSLARLNGWACAIKICHDGMLEDTNSLDSAHLSQRWTAKAHAHIQSIELEEASHQNRWSGATWSAVRAVRRITDHTTPMPLSSWHVSIIFFILVSENQAAVLRQKAPVQTSAVLFYYSQSCKFLMSLLSAGTLWDDSSSLSEFGIVCSRFSNNMGWWNSHWPDRLQRFLTGAPGVWGYFWCCQHYRVFWKRTRLFVQTANVLIWVMDSILEEMKQFQNIHLIYVL